MKSGTRVKVERRGTPGQPDHKLILSYTHSRVGAVGLIILFSTLACLVYWKWFFFLLYFIVFLFLFPPRQTWNTVKRLFVEPLVTITFDSKALHLRQGAKLLLDTLPYHQLRSILIVDKENARNSLFGLELLAVTPTGKKLLVPEIPGRDEANQLKRLVDEFLLGVDRRSPHQKWLTQKLLREQGFLQSDENTPLLLEGSTTAGLPIHLQITTGTGKMMRVQIETPNIPRSLHCCRRAALSAKDSLKGGEQGSRDPAFDDPILLKPYQPTGPITAWLKHEHRILLQRLFAMPVHDLQVAKSKVQFSMEEPDALHDERLISILRSLFETVDQLGASEDVVEELAHNVRTDPVAPVRAYNLHLLLNHDRKRGLSICREIVASSDTIDRKLHIFATMQLELEGEGVLKHLFALDLDDEEKEEATRRGIEAIAQQADVNLVHAQSLVQTLMERVEPRKILEAALQIQEKGIVILGVLLDSTIPQSLRVRALDQCASFWTNPDASQQVIRCLSNADALIADRALQIVTRRGPTEGVAYFESLEHHPIQAASDANRILFTRMYAHAEPEVAVPRLEFMLDHEKWEQRDALAQALTTMWQNHPTSLLPKHLLIRLLNDSITSVRATCVKAFGRQGTLEDIEFILPLRDGPLAEGGVADEARKAIEDIRSRLTVGGGHGQVSVVSADAIPKEAGAVSIDHEGGKVSIDDEAAKMSDAERGQVSIHP